MLPTVAAQFRRSLSALPRFPSARPLTSPSCGNTSWTRCAESPNPDRPEWGRASPSGRAWPESEEASAKVLRPFRGTERKDGNAAGSAPRAPPQPTVTPTGRFHPTEKDRGAAVPPAVRCLERRLPGRIGGRNPAREYHVQRLKRRLGRDVGWGTGWGIKPSTGTLVDCFWREISVKLVEAAGIEPASANPLPMGLHA